MWLTAPLAGAPAAGVGGARPAPTTGSARSVEVDVGRHLPLPLPPHTTLASPLNVALSWAITSGDRWWYQLALVADAATHFV